MHPGQARGLKSFLEHDFTWICAGGRGGKSSLIAAIIYSEFVRTPDTVAEGERWPKQILILAPQYKQARIIFGMVYRLVKKFGIPLKTDRFSEQAMELESTWGALLMCMTGRNKDAWAGFNWDFVVVDEAPIFRDGKAFEEIIFPTLLDEQGKFLAIGTPDYPGSFSHTWMLDGLDPAVEDWGFAHWTTIDNWFIPHAEEWIDKRRRTTPDDIIRRRYFAEYVSRSGLVYPEYLQCVHDFTAPTSGRYNRAIDFGFINPFACLVVPRVSDEFYVVDEIFETQMNKSELAPMLRAQDHEHPFKRSSFNVCDPADPEGIDYFGKWIDPKGGRIKGVWVRDYSKGGIMDRIDFVRRMMTSGLVHIHPRCRELVREYSVYAYPEKKVAKNISEKPVDSDNHGIKGFEYLTEYLFSGTFDLNMDSIQAGGKRKSARILKGYNG